MDSLFSFLFKHRPVVFDDGRFAFEAPVPSAVLLGALAVAALSAAAYLRQRRRLGRRGVVVLVGLRACAVALVAFALLRPVVRISTALPGENFLAVLIDDSRSMQLAAGELSRGERALDAFAADSSELLARLSERFTLRHYGFSATATRTDPATLAFDGRATDLGAALDQVPRDFAGVPLAGAVLVSDGAHRPGSGGADAELTETLLRLKSSGLPVYTVGLGDERFDPDVEIDRVEGPDRVLAGSAYAVDVTIRQRGYEGRTVTLTAEDDGAIVATREVTFSGGQATARVHLEAGETGPHRLRFSIAPGDGERVAENNARETLVTVEEHHEKILYVEGEPRWEVKFLRQALADDEHLRVVVFLRSAENKYARLGVDDPLELVAGFPSTREELFAYRGIVLGSVPASFFTAHQLRLLEEFVGQRGGGLLFLGGRRSFAAGGYAGTPLESVFPVVFEAGGAAAGDPDFLEEVRVVPTPEGRAHAALRLATTPEASAERWATLPPLTVRHPLYRLKPGASLLLAGTPAGGGDDLAVLAGQRYGRGRAAAFTVQDSWLWQMHADMALDDMTHERLWRQLLRWLVSTVPRQVTLEPSRHLVAPGERVSLTAEVRDAGHLGLNGARVTATVTDPAGEERTVPLEWTVERDGEYRGAFVAEQPGLHEVRLTAEDGGGIVGVDAVPLIAADLPTEHFGAEMNAPLLRRIAEETGGRFYTPGDLEDLAEDVRYTASGKTVIETLELWDMPIVLLLLLGALAAEWLLRRRWGLA